MTNFRKRSKLFSLLSGLTLLLGLLTACQDGTPKPATSPGSTTVAATTQATATTAASQTTTAATTDVAITTVTPSTTTVAATTAAPITTAAPLTTAASTATAVPVTTLAPSTAPVQTTAAPAGPTPTEASRGPESVFAYNLFVLEDLLLTQGGSEIQGKIGVGRDATVNFYSLATSITAGDGVVVGGKLNLSGGTVRGSVIYGGGLTQKGTNFLGGSPVQKANPLDLNAQRVYLEKAADGWAAMAPNGTTSIEYGVAKLTGSDQALNVFSLTATDLASANSIELTAPPTSSVIINVNGPTASIANLGLRFSGLDRQRIVFNFHQATSLTLTSISVEGLVMAPRAAVNFTNGGLKGAIIAHTLIGGSVRFENYPYLGKLPTS